MQIRYRVKGGLYNCLKIRQRFSRKKKLWADDVTMKKVKRFSHFLLKKPQSIYGLFGGTIRKVAVKYKLKLEHEDKKDARYL